MKFYCDQHVIESNRKRVIWTVNWKQQINNRKAHRKQRVYVFLFIIVWSKFDDRKQTVDVAYLLITETIRAMEQIRIMYIAFFVIKGERERKQKNEWLIFSITNEAEQQQKKKEKRKKRTNAQQNQLIVQSCRGNIT